MTEHICL